MINQSSQINLNRIIYELKILEMKEHSKAEVEWSSCYFNILIHSLISEFQGEVIIEKGERPDFKYRYPDVNTDISVEITMATNEAYQAATRKLQGNDNIKYLENASYSNNSTMKTKEMNKGLVFDGDELRGPGWTGWEAESQWSHFITDAITRKIKKYNEYNFDQLMIFDDSPVSGWINVGLAARLFRKNSSLDSKFTVNIWTGNFFIYDLLQECKLIGISKDNLTFGYFPMYILSKDERPGVNPLGYLKVVNKNKSNLIQTKP